MKTVIRLLSLTLAFIAGTNHLSGQARKQAMVSGKVISTSNEIMDFATVQVKGTSIGTRPNEKGIYHLKVDAGKHTLVFKAMGYATVERTVTLQAGERQKLNVKMHQKDMELAEVKVEASHVGRINKSAFNAVAVDLKGMAGLNKNLAEVLTTVPGVKLRETGGMGSDMQLMLDGFTGKHVKVFIDGVPQEGAGTALNLNNLPVNFAERIEVYRGVVPVGFGTDALAGSSISSPTKGNSVGLPMPLILTARSTPTNLSSTSDSRSRTVCCMKSTLSRISRTTTITLTTTLRNSVTTVFRRTLTRQRFTT